MARIEQFIREHRSDFDMQEPDEGHFGRFAALLDQQESKPVHMINRGKILRIAAVILLLISLWQTAALGMGLSLLWTGLILFYLKRRQSPWFWYYGALLGLAAGLFYGWPI